MGPPTLVTLVGRGDEELGPLRLGRRQVGLAVVAGVGQGHTDAPRGPDRVEVDPCLIEPRMQLVQVDLG